MIGVVVADDHPIVREGIEGILDAAEGVALLGTASDGEDAIDVVARTAPDVLLLDLRMPRCDGLDVIAHLRARGVDRPRILVLTTYDTERDVRAAMRAGADGFLLKDAPPAVLMDAVRRVARGEAVLAPSAVRALARSETPRLTAREADVLREVAGGGTNREAAARLFISESTLKTHLARVFDKLGVADRAAAVRTAFEEGLL